MPTLKTIQQCCASPILIAVPISTFKKKSHKGQCTTCPRFCCRKHPCRNTKQFVNFYHIIQTDEWKKPKLRSPDAILAGKNKIVTISMISRYI